MKKVVQKAAFWIGSVALLGLQANAQTLPDGEGKELVQKICTACHGLETALADGHDEAAWRKLVNTMIARGAEGSDAEFDTVVKYLAKNFPQKAASAAKPNVHQVSAKTSLR